MGRLIRFTAAALVLLVVLAAVPWALIQMAGNPLPSKVPDWSNAARMIEQGNVQATTVINVLACIVWAAWVFVTWAIVWEVVVNVPRLLKGSRPKAAPLAPAPITRGVGWLFAFLLASSTMTQTVAAAPSLGSLVEPDDGPRIEHELDAATTSETPRTVPRSSDELFNDGETTQGWVVAVDDTLWSIAQTSGASIDEIIAANPGLDAASLLVEESVLILPEHAEIPDDRNASQPAAILRSAQPASDPASELAVDAAVYVVQPNDGWRNVAAALLGDEERFVEMQQRAIGQEVAPGVVFSAEMAVIHPGWVFTAGTPSALAHLDSGEVSHVVAPGDTLSSIAAEHLGDSDRWPELWERNAGDTMEDGTVFDDPNLIHPSWTIEVADAPPTTSNSDTTVEPEVAAPDSSVEAAPQAPSVPTDQPDEPVDATVDVDDTAPANPDAPSSTETGAGDESLDVLPAPTLGQTPASIEAPVTSTPTSAPARAGDSAAPVDAQGVAAMSSVRDVRPVWLAGITGATALASALWLLVRSRRQRSAVRGGGKVTGFDESTSTIDEALRASADTELVNWANAELAELVSAHGLNDSLALPVLAELSRQQGLTIHWEPPHPSDPAGWAVDAHGTSWSKAFDPTRSTFGIAPVAIPGLVTVGSREDHHVLLDVESCGSLSVFGDATAAESLVRSIVLELGAGGVLSNAHVHTVGLDVDGAEHLARVHVRSEDDAIEHLRSIRVQHDQVLHEAERASMFEVRSASTPEGRDLTVIAVRASSCVRLDELLEAAQPQRGVAVVVVGEIDGIPSIEIAADGAVYIDPLGVTIGAAGVSRQVASTLAVHLDQLHDVAESDDVAEPPAVEKRLGDLVEPKQLIRVLGEPTVDDCETLTFSQVELLAFVAANASRVTDDDVAADMASSRLQRHDVWDLVSNLRAESGELLAPTEEGSNVIALSDGVVSDVDWMRHLAWRSHPLDDTAAVDELLAALDLVGGRPYDAAGGFDWAIPSGAYGLALQTVERSAFLLASRAISADRTAAASTALRGVLDRLGPNEPITQALVRLERHRGNDTSARSAVSELSRELVFLSDGARPLHPSHATAALLEVDAELLGAAVKVEAEPAAVDDVEGEVQQRTTVRPTVVLRTFGDVCAEGATKTQALAAVFAVAAHGRAMTNDDIAEVTGYGTKSLSTVFTTDHHLLARHDGELSLRPGVWTDHQWIAECARRAADADADGDVHAVADSLHTLFAEVVRIDGAPFEKTPGKKTYWNWVDEFPADVTARATAENEMVSAVLHGIDVWTSARADEQIPAEVVVRAACNLARIAPYASVASSVRPSEVHSGAEALLRAAHAAATGRVELVHSVVSTAQKLVADGKIEASNDLADALGL